MAPMGLWIAGWVEMSFTKKGDCQGEIDLGEERDLCQVCRPLQ